MSKGRRCLFFSDDHHHELITGQDTVIICYVPDYTLTWGLIKIKYWNSLTRGPFEHTIASMICGVKGNRFIRHNSLDLVVGVTKQFSGPGLAGSRLTKT